MKLYPIALTPFLKETIWGGTQIKEYFSKEIPLEKCAESWELSDREDGMCVIQNGMYEGKTLHDLVKQFPKELIGREENHFPLLIKLIDANLPLSIQVHPDEHAAKYLNSDPKTEMWVVIACEEYSKVYVGFNKEVSKEDFATSLEEETLLQYLNEIPIQAGDCIFIPAGTVHAIFSGCLLYEIQQNSNTTYRIYDWGRTDSFGNERELHIPQAMEAIHFNKKITPKQKPQVIHESQNYTIELLVQCPYFKTTRVSIGKNHTFQKSLSSFQYLFFLEGAGVVQVGEETLEFKRGEGCLIPAACLCWSILPSENTVYIQTSLE